MSFLLLPNVTLTQWRAGAELRTARAKLRNLSPGGAARTGMDLGVTVSAVLYWSSGDVRIGDDFYAGAEPRPYTVVAVGDETPGLLPGGTPLYVNRVRR